MARLFGCDGDGMVGFEELRGRASNERSAVFVERFYELMDLCLISTSLSHSRQPYP